MMMGNWEFEKGNIGILFLRFFRVQLNNGSFSEGFEIQ